MLMMSVVVRNVDDTDNLTTCLNCFQKAISASINWEKCTILMEEWREIGPPQLPQQCQWTRDGFKVLRIYFGTDDYMEKKKNVKEFLTR